MFRHSIERVFGEDYQPPIPPFDFDAAIHYCINKGLPYIVIAGILYIGKWIYDVLSAQPIHIKNPNSFPSFLGDIRHRNK